MTDKHHNPLQLDFQKWRVRTILIVILMAVVALTTYHHYTHRSEAFIQNWSQRFLAIKSLEEAKLFEKTEPVYVRTFPSGEWIIATCEHSCCSGAGFNASVIRDSTETIYTDTTHTFCGIEGMSEELHQVTSDTLTAFYPQLKQLKLQKR